MLRFAEELLLLLLDERTGEFSHVPARTLGYALAGAVLMDLALEGRIDTDVNSLTLTDPTPLGDNLLDPILVEIAKESLPPSPEAWVRRIAEQAYDLRDKTIERLVEKGILETDEGRTAFSLSHLVKRTRRYPLASGEHQQEIYDRIISILFSDDIPSPSDVVCIGLAHACGILKRTLTPAEYAEVEERIRLISGLDLIGHSVINAVQKLRTPNKKT